MKISKFELAAVKRTASTVKNLRRKAENIKKIIDNHPELQRHIADVITGRQGRNGNAGRNNYENADNRRGTTNSTYTGGI